MDSMATGPKLRKSAVQTLRVAIRLTPKVTSSPVVHVLQKRAEHDRACHGHGRGEGARHDGLPRAGQEEPPRLVSGDDERQHARGKRAEEDGEAEECSRQKQERGRPTSAACISSSSAENPSR